MIFIKIKAKYCMCLLDRMESFIKLFISLSEGPLGFKSYLYLQKLSLVRNQTYLEIDMICKERMYTHTHAHYRCTIYAWIHIDT